MSTLYDLNTWFLWLILGLAITYLWFGLDDVFVDSYAWLTGLKPKRLTPADIARLQALPEKRIAVIIPAWQESNVIGRMLLGNLSAISYQNVDFFVGVYPNDAETLAEVAAVAATTSRVVAVIGDRPGPTSKGQILNCVVRELAARGSYAAVLMQDAEDMMHPLALSLLNHELDRADFVQMPVFSMQVRHTKLVAGTYMDEFAESHTKDLLVRAAMGASVPSAGVSTGLSWHLVKTMQAAGGGLFNESSLTEDYELGLRAHELGLRAVFSCAYVQHPDRRDFIATREFFPSQFRRSIRQKTRWVTGIALQGWRNLGWSRSPVESYWRYRDRKAILTNPLSFLGYGGAVWMMINYGLRMPYEIALEHATIDLRYVLAFNLVFMVNRYAQRCICTGRVYGGGFVPLVLVRWPLAILINGLACVRALANDTAVRLLDRAHHWEKTEHELPQGFGLESKSITQLH